MNKMKSMPGMDNLQQLFTQMGLSNLGGKGKINTNAMDNKLKQNLKTSKLKERMKEKLKLNKYKENKVLDNNNTHNSLYTEEELYKMFNINDGPTTKIKVKNNKNKK
jgi:hypothetical protein